MSTLTCAEAYVAIATQQLNELAHFYEALLQQPPHPFQAHVYAEFKWMGLKLGLFQPTLEHAAEFAHPAQAAISLCLEFTDLDRAIAHLKTLGHPPDGPIMMASHGREVYAYDLDGNRLILHQSS
jgi:predicted enzyme related to lactoylglutathione lyase